MSNTPTRMQNKMTYTKVINKDGQDGRTERRSVPGRRRERRLGACRPAIT